MPNLAELQEKRNKLFGEMKELREAFKSNGDVWKDAEQGETWKRLNADYDATSREMDAARAADEVDSRFAELEEAQGRSVNEGRGIAGREDRSGLTSQSRRR